MAGHNNNEKNSHEESSPLLSKQVDGVEKKAEKPVTGYPKTQAPVKSPAPEHNVAGVCGWTVDGLPLGHGSVVGEPISRTQWNSGICACLGRNDEFCSSDIEVCCLGSVAPCVLYGSNVERLGSSPGTFANHCLPYTGLYLIGNSLFGWNFLTPWFSYTSRSAMRRKLNLEGTCESLHRSFGCCGSCVEDEVQLEQCESVCDLATHVFCHTCALCQEGRELRRRLPHPGFNAQPVLVMIPPGEQVMGRGA
ncbi:hypothetical protein FNV43_RR16784 [Rhamnella rubrinervis]|uniref:Cell number regulator 8-like n=1 Tax=Rhamnella rubrinervis TaxID=2594499 RepID=A0A8K0MDT4_9ROSA|nr:hypothetical protein FNV43_RR16784 [Rhamnella rubrinervis]